MHLTITARHFKLQDELKNYINHKVSKLRRIYDGIVDLEVVLGWEKLSRYTEFKINVDNGTIVIRENSEELRKSFDKALDRALRQVKRHKDKFHRIEKR